MPAHRGVTGKVGLVLLFIGVALAALQLITTGQL